MTSKFRHVALVGKYQASTASDASTAQSREVLQDIADFLQTQGCEVIVEAETAAHKAAPPKSLPRYPQGVSEHPTTREVFALMSWRDPRLFAISQAGLVEKFVDALVWAVTELSETGRGEPRVRSI